jgi:hypothetical protein
MMPPVEPLEADRERLAHLAKAIRHFENTVRYIDYRQAEQDCEQLAAMILGRFSRSDLDRFSFSAIPRGGLIVLGMLSYLLDLRPEQLRAPAADAPSLFLVDDCALTGARLATHLEQTAAQEIVFATLYSHPALRRAVLERETRVSACLAAHDLDDHEDLSAGEVQDWRQRWSERLDGKRYWLGPTELVCFAWSEPDHPFWNPATEAVEDGWRWLPPHLCLKTRSLLAGPSPAAAPREWQSPAHVVSGELDGTLWLCQTKTDRVYSLRGVGADVWRLLACWGHLEPVVAKLTEVYDVDADTARRDARTFSAELESAGLLERVHEDLSP